MPTPCCSCALIRWWEIVLNLWSVKGSTSLTFRCEPWRILRAYISIVISDCCPAPTQDTKHLTVSKSTRKRSIDQIFAPPQWGTSCTYTLWHTCYLVSWYWCLKIKCQGSQLTRGYQDNKIFNCYLGSDLLAPTLQSVWDHPWAKYKVGENIIKVQPVVWQSKSLLSSPLYHRLPCWCAGVHFPYLWNQAVKSSSCLFKMRFQDKAWFPKRVNRSRAHPPHRCSAKPHSHIANTLVQELL